MEVVEGVLTRLWREWLRHRSSKPASVGSSPTSRSFRRECSKVATGSPKPGEVGSIPYPVCYRDPLSQPLNPKGRGRCFGVKGVKVSGMLSVRGAKP